MPVSSVENMLGKEKNGISTKKVRYQSQIFRTGGGFNKNAGTEELGKKVSTKSYQMQENYRIFMKYQNSGDLGQ